MESRPESDTCDLIESPRKQWLKSQFASQQSKIDQKSTDAHQSVRANPYEYYRNTNSASQEQGSKAAEHSMWSSKWWQHDPRELRHAS